MDDICTLIFCFKILIVFDPDKRRAANKAKTKNGWRVHDNFPAERIEYVQCLNQNEKWKLLAEQTTSNGERKGVSYWERINSDDDPGKELLVQVLSEWQNKCLFMLNYH